MQTGIVGADDWLEDSAGSCGVDAATSLRVRVCVAELAANLMQHGAPAPGATFTVTLAHDGGDVSLDYFDRGCAFDPTLARDDEALRRVGDAQIGGFGLHLLRSYASLLTYERDADLNHVSLLFASRGVSASE
jgi:anti-sigma regulatory factor (Ser/Thr protein kinase)